MEFSSAIYRGDPCPEFSFSFKFICDIIKSVEIERKSDKYERT